MSRVRVLQRVVRLLPLIANANMRVTERLERDLSLELQLLEDCRADSRGEIVSDQLIVALRLRESEAAILRTGKEGDSLAERLLP